MAGTVTDIRYAAPASQLLDVARERIPRPRRVSQALSLLWISYFLGFPSAFDPANTGSLLTRTIAVLILAPLGALLLIFIAKGRNWARVTFTVFVALEAISMLARVNEPWSIYHVLDVISGALDFVGTGLLLSSAAAEYYRPPPALWSA